MEKIRIFAPAGYKPVQIGESVVFDKVDTPNGELDLNYMDIFFEEEEVEHNVTKWPTEEDQVLAVNEVVAIGFDIRPEHLLMELFSDNEGEWQDEEGNAISGAFTYKANP